MNDRLVVISGCSGGGKSSLLAELQARGHRVVEEPGRRIIAEETVTGGSTRYVSPDYLGSTRMITGSAGQALARYDYQSFGEEIPAGIGGRSAVAGYVTADNAKQPPQRPQKRTKQKRACGRRFGFR